MYGGGRSIEEDSSFHIAQDRVKTRVRSEILARAACWLLETTTNEFNSCHLNQVPPNIKVLVEMPRLAPLAAVAAMFAFFLRNTKQDGRTLNILLNHDKGHDDHVMYARLQGWWTHRPSA